MTESEAVFTSGFYPWIDFGSYKIQSYFFVISLVLCLCAIWTAKRSEKAAVNSKRALDIFIAAVIGGFLGSRLLHIFWEEPDYYMRSPLRIFDLMAGGFVWYGGAIGAVLSIVALLKFKRDRNLLGWLDFFAPIAAIGYAGGRFACFLTGCCFGRVCEWQGSWFHFPTQGFSVLWELSAGSILLWLEKKKKLPIGGVFSLWLVLHGVGRAIMESFRADPRGPSFGVFTISMAISAAFIFVGVLIVIRQSGRTKI